MRSVHLLLQQIVDMGLGSHAAFVFPYASLNRVDDVSDGDSDDNQGSFRQSYLEGSRTQSGTGSVNVLSVAAGPLRRG